MADIYLDVLGRRAELRTKEESMGRVVETLWRPFITEPGEPFLQMDLSLLQGEWTLTVADEVSIYTNPWRAVDHVRHLILDRCLANVEPLIVLHGAVLERDGRALVLAGPSGAGKTTLTLRLLERGWVYVSDDVAPFDPATGEIVSFLKPVNVKDVESWRTYSSRWSPPDWEVEPVGGLPIPASALPATSQSRVSPAQLVFCAFSPGRPSRLGDLSVAQALARGGELVRHLDRENLGRLRTLVENTSRATLEYEEAGQAVELLETWLFRSQA